MDLAGSSWVKCKSCGSKKISIKLNFYNVLNIKLAPPSLFTASWSLCEAGRIMTYTAKFKVLVYVYYITFPRLTYGSFFWSVSDVLQHCFVDTDKIKAQTQSDCLPQERYSMIVHGSHVSLKKESQTSEIFIFLHSVRLGRFCYRA